MCRGMICWPSKTESLCAITSLTQLPSIKLFILLCVMSMCTYTSDVHHLFRDVDWQTDGRSIKRFTSVPAPFTGVSHRASADSVGWAGDPFFPGVVFFPFLKRQALWFCVLVVSLLFSHWQIGAPLLPSSLKSPTPPPFFLVFPLSFA